MLKVVRFLGFVLFIFALTNVVFAQRKPVKKPAATAAQTAQTAGEKEQRRIDEESVAAMKDPGFDMAVVVKVSSIRETGDAKGIILSSVKRGEFLSLVQKEAENDWYKVVREEDGLEGWIDGKSVVIKLTGNKQTGPPLVEEAAAAATVAPEVSITNLEPKTTLRIRLNGKLYLIPPGTTKIVQMSAGKINYYGWSPGIRAATGSGNLQNGKRYAWTFQINRR